MPPSLPRLLPRENSNEWRGTDGHEENKSMETVVRLVMHCGLSGGSGKLDGGGGWLKLFRRSPKPLT